MNVLSWASGLAYNVVPVHKYIRRWKAEEDFECNRLLTIELKKDPQLTASQLKGLHLDLLSNVRVRTIQHRLQKDLGLPSRTAAKKPHINDRMKEQRLAFAKKHAHWTPTQWKKVMFSDESTFQVFRVGSTKVRRLSSANRYDPRYTVTTVKHPQSVMVWGAFSSDNGRVELLIHPKNVMMNGDLYIKILIDHMVTMFELHQCSHFMHDSAPCHKANKVTKWLQTKKIEALECHWNGPDLNLIENCCHNMKHLMSERKPTNSKGNI